MSGKRGLPTFAKSVASKVRIVCFKLPLWIRPSTLFVIAKHWDKHLMQHWRRKANDRPPLWLKISQITQLSGSCQAPICVRNRPSCPWHNNSIWKLNWIPVLPSGFWEQWSLQIGTLNYAQRLKISISVWKGGETSRVAQDRGISVLHEIIQDTLLTTAIVTYGNLMTLLLHYFDNGFGFEQWANLANPDVYQPIQMYINWSLMVLVVMAMIGASIP